MPVLVTSLFVSEFPFFSRGSKISDDFGVLIKEIEFLVFEYFGFEKFQFEDFFNSIHSFLENFQIEDSYELLSRFIFVALRTREDFLFTISDKVTKSDIFLGFICNYLLYLILLKASVPIIENIKPIPNVLRSARP